MEYRKYAPTQYDPKGICLEDRQDWLVLPCEQNRDSEPLSRSNFDVLLNDFGGESETVEVHRFGHWACGWFEIIIVHPSLKEKVEDWERALEDYPVADDEDLSEKEMVEANEVWERCYDWEERVEYIRKNRSQFEFRNREDLMQCVRGEYFCGYASELIA